MAERALDSTLIAPPSLLVMIMHVIIFVSRMKSTKATGEGYYLVTIQPYTHNRETTTTTVFSRAAVNLSQRQSRMALQKHQSRCDTLKMSPNMSTAPVALPLREAQESSRLIKIMATMLKAARAVRHHLIKAVMVVNSKNETTIAQYRHLLQKIKVSAIVTEKRSWMNRQSFPLKFKK